MSPAEWTHGVYAACAGLLCAAFFGHFLLARRPARDADDSARAGADVSRRIETLLEHLREMADERGKVEPSRYAAERDAAERETARLFAERDRLAARLGARAPAAGGGRSARTPLGWAAAVALFAGLSSFFLVRGLAPRGEGDALTGGGPAAAPAAATAGAAPDARRTADSLRAAHEALLAGSLERARELTGRTLLADPANVEANLHRLVLMGTGTGTGTAAGTAAGGPGARVLAALAELSKSRPDFDEALLFHAWTAERLGRLSEAKESYRRFLRRRADPRDRDFARRALAALR